MNLRDHNDEITQQNNSSDEIIDLSFKIMSGPIATPAFQKFIQLFFITICFQK
uniref:Bm497 n=1 Tax=Brugia malayi TaxID=6279 RepID=A0A1I9G2M8_BRUMA|nr:Bm497 [Brugia malayi]